MYDTDFDFEECCEPSLLDEIINDASEKVKDIVKAEVKTFYEGLKLENARLALENADLKEKVSEIERKERELKFEKSDLLKTVRRERLSELMKDFEVVLYKATKEAVKLPKCNKCDGERRICYKSPLGKEMMEYCDCNERSHYNYRPDAYYASEFRKDNNTNNKIIAWYKHAPSYLDKENDTYGYSSSTFCSELIEGDFDFENKKIERETFFRDEALCQRYCDYLNAKETEVSK